LREIVGGASLRSTATLMVARSQAAMKGENFCIFKAAAEKALAMK